MREKNSEYRNGDIVNIGGYNFVVRGYHNLSGKYVLQRADGVCLFLNPDEFSPADVPPMVDNWKAQ